MLNHKDIGKFTKVVERIELLSSQTNSVQVKYNYKQTEAAFLLIKCCDYK